MEGELEGWTRPRTRGDCVPDDDAPHDSNHARPCPWVGCKYHLAVHVVPPNETVAHAESFETDPRKVRRSARLRVITDDPETLPVTCALDVADERSREDELERTPGTKGRAKRPTTERALAQCFGMTRQAVDLITRAALRKLHNKAPELDEAFQHVLAAKARYQDQNVDGEDIAYGETLSLSSKKFHPNGSPDRSPPQKKGVAWKKANQPPRRRP